MAHRNAQRLRAALVLLKGPRPTAEELACPPLTEPEGSPNLRHLSGTEHAVDFGLELLERLVVRDKRIAGEDRLATLPTPPAEGLQRARRALVFEHIVAPLVAHDAAARRARLRLATSPSHRSLLLERDHEVALGCSAVASSPHTSVGWHLKGVSQG